MPSFDGFPLIESLDGVAYLTDPEGRIMSYGQEHWNAFAESNGAPDLCNTENVLGTSLFDIVRGKEVRDVYRRMMDEVMAGERSSFSFRFSCEAPDVCRSMRMALTPVSIEDETVGVLFHAVTLRTEMRPPLDIFECRNMSAVFGFKKDRAVRQDLQLLPEGDGVVRQRS